MNLLQSADGLLAAAEALSSTSEDYGNDSRVEALWAMKAINHAEVYFNVRSCDRNKLQKEMIFVS